MNTSLIGHNLFDKKSKDKSSADKVKDGGLLGDVENWLHDVEGEAKSIFGDITGQIADKLANKLGVSQWYSLHTLNSCEGSYSPNSTAHSPSLNVTNCTSASPTVHLNLTKILDHELKVGSLKLNLADIGWPDTIQDKLDILNDALLGLFIVYALGVGFTGLSVISSFAAFFAPGRRRIIFTNFFLALFGFHCMFIGAIIVTVASSKGVDRLNKEGEKVGLSASRGTKFYILSWIATGFMLIVAAFWIGQFCTVRRQKKKDKKSEMVEKTVSNGKQ